MIQIHVAPLLNALLFEELMPIVSLAEGAGSGYRSPVEPPATRLSPERWAGVTFSWFNPAARVNHPATVLFFQLKGLQEKSDDRGI